MRPQICVPVFILRPQICEAMEFTDVIGVTEEAYVVDNKMAPRSRTVG